MSEALAAASAVALGALIGGPARLFVTEAITRRAGDAFPWATLAINVLGSFAIGAAAAYAHARGLTTDSLWWLAVVTGALGSFTTVSSFALQTLALTKQRRFTQAFAYAAASLILCLGAAASGFALAGAMH